VKDKSSRLRICSE